MDTEKSNGVDNSSEDKGKVRSWPVFDGTLSIFILLE